MLASRYRIIGRLGRGGMGEVYRADDLTLGQPVALKFLPPAATQDSGFIERFRAEVRNARGVSHPNVCRVYDIGEVDGQPFISMEYVDGEDLATLLKRIGRLPGAKALEIARQLCAGLAAAHDKNVLHRDLKPANIMIDGQGRARITDFGLAVRSEEAATDGQIVGTPAYMAPEQLAGKGATAKSDIYALGLVFYEIFTGRKAFEASTVAELRRKHAEEQPASPSSHISDVDPAVERVILRCLEKDPRQRPASALAIAAALPGGDPLAAALAAGETPSPELVAAAGETEGLRPAVAVACLALTVAGLLLACFLSDKANLTSLVSFEYPPEVLAAKARDLTSQLGYAPGIDHASGFIEDDDYLDYVRNHDQSPERWKSLAKNQPAAVIFWYRESPRPLAVEKFFAGGNPFLVVTPEDPARTVSGMTYVEMDLQGRLLRFEAIPPQVETPESLAPAPDWSSLFAATALDPTKFRSATPRWTPLVWGDTRVAWEGSFPQRPDVPLRVEAAAYRGKPVYFRLVTPWTEAERDRLTQTTIEFKLSIIVMMILFWSVVLGGVLLARRNLRLGRSDRRGAYRLAGFVGVGVLLLVALTAKHVGNIQELWIFLMGASDALFDAAFVWIAYIALEPYARRRWPQALIAWNRLLSGRLSDPLVGRDLLVGVLIAVGRFLLVLGRHFVAGWVTGVPPAPQTVAAEPLLGTRMALGMIPLAFVLGIIWAFALFFLFFLLRALLRREWLAALVFTSLWVMAVLPSEHPVVYGTYMALVYGSLVLLMTRLGLVAFASEQIAFYCLINPPLTFHLGAWNGAPTIVVLAALIGAAAYGFRTSLAGRPVFSGSALDT